MRDDFDVKEGWTLLNDYTIQRIQEENAGRAHMLACVPRQLNATLTDLRCIMGVAWADRHRLNRFNADREGDVLASDDEEVQKGTFEQLSKVSAKATFQDRLTVFSIEGGREFELEEPVQLLISSAPAGLVGGKHNATSMDGIEFSAFSAQKLPEKGLMEGEPGRLWINDDGTAELHLHIDEDVFRETFWQITANLNRLHSAAIEVVAELFVDELEADLNEGDFPYNYGILKKPKSGVVATAARLDSLRLSFRPESSQTADTDEHQNADIDQLAGNIGPTPTDRFREEQLDAVRRTNRLLTWTIAGLAALSVIVLLSR